MVMKKTLIFCMSALLLLTTMNLTAANKKEMWMNAITEKDLNTKLQKLMEYKAEFDDPKDDNYTNLYYNITYTVFQLKKFSESIEYAEKTLQIPGLQDNLKLNLYLMLANAYNITKQDLKKAAEYADMVVGVADNLKKLTSGNADDINRMDNGYVSPALRIQASIYLQLGKNGDHSLLLKASEKSIAAFEIDKAQTSLAFALQAFSSLAKEKKSQEAVSVMEAIHQKREGTSKEFDALAQIYYHHLNNKEKAVEYWEKAYQKTPSADLASRLGTLLQKQNPSKAVDYLADEFAFTDSRESQTFKLLEHLYFNVVYKDQTHEEKEAGFNTLLETAKSRVKK